MPSILTQSLMIDSFHKWAKLVQKFPDFENFSQNCDVSEGTGIQLFEMFIFSNHWAIYLLQEKVRTTGKWWSDIKAVKKFAWIFYTSKHTDSDQSELYSIKKKSIFPQKDPEKTKYFALACHNRFQFFIWTSVSFFKNCLKVVFCF